MDALRYADAQAVLTQLGPLSSELVLIGGQAVNYWAEAYAPRAAELQQAGPFASKDVDFCGNVQQAEECARRLHGRCLVATPDDLTRRSAVVEYVDAFQRPRSLDFLTSPFGIDGEEVRALAIVVESNNTAHGAQLSRIMHPVHVLESRAWNVSQLPGYRTEKGLKQLRAAVVCAREFGRDLLDAGKVRDVLRLNERIFRFALREPGLDVWRHDGIAVFDAVVRDPRLPEAFERLRHPQMQQALQLRQRAEAQRSPAAEVFVVESIDLRGTQLVATLRAPDGSLRELPNFRHGRVELGRGDRVRLDRGGGLELVSRAPDRGWER